jgi:adenosylhomocysteine nucleosidase
MATSSASKLPILVVAALGRELASLKREPHPELELLETGEGTANAERRLEARLAERIPRAVLSIGFAGALSADLQIGDLVIAQTIHSSIGAPDGKLLEAAARLQLESAARFGKGVTSERILWQASEKRAMATLLAPGEIGFVDMESTAIASACSRHGVPFLIARCISDLLDEDLPIDFNQCRDREGRVSATKVMRAALTKPSSINGLLELRKRSELCAERLAGFVLRIVELIG